MKVGVQWRIQDSKRGYHGPAGSRRHCTEALCVFTAVSVPCRAQKKLLLGRGPVYCFYVGAQFLSMQPVQSKDLIIIATISQNGGWLDVSSRSACTCIHTPLNYSHKGG